jgi:hypothetical protein
MKKLYCMLTAFILLSSFFNCYPQIKTGVFTMSYTESGTGAIRSFYMDVPTDYDSLKSYPLLYAWHGAGMPASSMLANMQVLNTNIKAIICCPDVNGMTVGTQLAAMFQTSIQYAERYNINPYKKIITGFSMGGNYAFQIGLGDTTKFQGIIAFSPATNESQFTTGMWNNIKGIRMAAIVGTLDANWTAVNALILNIKSKGGNLYYLPKKDVTHDDAVYYSSQEFFDDYQNCYKYVIGLINSIGENQAGNNLNMQVYPNPFNNKTEIETNRAVNKPLNLTVYDVYGKKVFEEINNSISTNERITLNLENLKPGIYMLMVSDGVRTSSQKIIKQN